MPIATYRIIAPTIAILIKDDHQVAQTIDVDAFVTTTSDAHLENDGLIEVKLQGKPAWMFAQDLRVRSIEVRRDGGEGGSQLSRSAAG
jgi:hypothetical protein